MGTGVSASRSPGETLATEGRMESKSAMDRVVRQTTRPALSDTVGHFKFVLALWG